MAVQSLGSDGAMMRLERQRAAGPAGFLPASARPLRARSPMRTTDPSSSPAALVVQVRSLSQMDEERAAWSELSANALETNVFQEAGFMLAAGRRLGAAPARFAAVRQGERLVGLFPLTHSRIGLCRGWSIMFTPYGVPLVDRLQAPAVLSAFLDWLRGEGGGIILSQVEANGPFGRALQAAAERKNLRFHLLGGHHRAALRPGDRTALSARKVKELRRLSRRLGEAGDVRIERASAPADVARALEIFLAIERSGWKGRSGSALASRPETDAFVREMTADLAAGSDCRIDILHAGETPVAAGILLRSGARTSFWKIAYDERFARFSPGVLLTLDLIERPEMEGAQLVDSCAIAGHPMIDAVWPSRIAVADIAVEAPGAGWRFAAGLCLETAQRRLREKAKHAYHALRHLGAPKRPGA